MHLRKRFCESESSTLMLLNAAITVIRQNKSERTLKSIASRISFGVGLQKKHEIIPQASAAVSTASFLNMVKIRFANELMNVMRPLFRYTELTVFRQYAGLRRLC